MTATACGRLLRRSVVGVGPYVPGASAQETKARLGRDDLIRLNWNENLFGPLDGVLQDTAAQMHACWTYPEEAYDEFRGAVADWTGADPREVIPGHGIQALTLAVISAFVEPGDAVVIPRPTYGLYAQACAAAGATAHRVDAPRPALAFDMEAIAARARNVNAKLVWICDPNNPTGLRLRADEWSEFLDSLPDGCMVVADEAYVDYIEPAQRIDRLADIRAGRPLIVLRTSPRSSGWRACGSAPCWCTRRWRPTSTPYRSPSTSTWRPSPRGPPACGAPSCCPAAAIRSAPPGRG
jgi:histidinol-phosphate aminotransferase